MLHRTALPDPERQETVTSDHAHARLPRRLGTADAVTIGLGAMIGAGIFAAFAPAARAAGAGVPIALALAAAVAYCNAISSARLAARYPESGGTYVYGRERLGEFWGFLAGWSFVLGKTASCAAMALTAGHYIRPEYARAFGVAAVAVVVAVDYAGIRKSLGATRLVLVAVLASLAAIATVALTSPRWSGANLAPDSGITPGGVLQAAGLLFFAFAGYARIATLGEEVRDPARTIRRAVPLALGITLVVYTVVMLATLGMLGPAVTAATEAPLAAAVRAAVRS